MVDKEKRLNELRLENKIETFRKFRALHFKAFDIWERAVIRGREIDSQEVMNWYKSMLDFTEDITLETEVKDYPQIPEVLKKYL